MITTNEAEAVWDAGGELWKVTRPGTEPRAMDTMLENWQFDRHIKNTGTLGDLERKVNSAWYLHFKNTAYPYPLGRVMCECGWFYEIQDDDDELIQPIIDAHNRSNPRKNCDKVHPEYDIYHQDGHCGSKIKNRAK